MPDVPAELGAADSAIDYIEVSGLLAAAEAARAGMEREFQRAEDAYNLHYGGAGDGASDRFGGNHSGEIAGIKLPADAAVHIPSTGPATVDNFVAQVRLEDPRVQIGRIRGGSTSAERAEKLRRLGAYSLRMIEFHEDEPVFAHTRFSLGNLGAACIRILFDEERWPTDREARKVAWPFAIRNVHPSNVFVPADGRWPYRWVIERQRRHHAEISHEYPAWQSTATGPKATDEVEILFYWDADQYVMFAGGVEVLRRPNMLGIPPYVWGYSLLGHKDADNDPASLAYGVLRHSLSELSAEVRLRTMADALWQQTVWPTLQGPFSEEEFKNRWGVGAGRYVQRPSKDEGFEWLAPPGPSEALYTLLPELKQSIEKSTFSEVLGGLRGGESGVDSGILLGQARLKVDSIRSALERMLGRTLAIIARYVDKVLLQPLDADGAAVGPKVISGHYDFSVSLEALDPALNDRRVSTGLNLFISKAITLREFLTKYYKHDDPDGLIAERLAEIGVEQYVAAGGLLQAIQQVIGLDKQAVQSATGGLLDRPVAGGIDELERGAPVGARDASALQPGGEGPLGGSKTGQQGAI